MIDIENLSITYPLARYKYRQTYAKEVKQKTGGQIIRPKKGVARVLALENFSLRIQSGERLGILGHNGAGKSTLLRAIIGIYPPGAGQIRVRGRIASMIDIQTGFDNESSGLSNIRLRALFMGISEKELEEEIDNVAEFTELGEYLDAPLRSYSSGMRARLAFAIATGFHPQIIVMDEWLSAGDRHFRDKARERLSSFVDKADILIMASHSDEMIKKVCNRAIILDNGHLVFDGPVDEAIEFRKQEAA